jgi:hypothetical protein
MICKIRFLFVSFFLINNFSYSQAIWEPMSGVAGEVLSFYKYENYLYAGTSLGWVLRTSDRGVTWENASRLGIYSIYAFTSTPGYLFAGASNGIFRYDVAENLWTKISTRHTRSLINRYGVVDTSFAIIASGNAGIYISYNNGETWVPSYISSAVTSLHGNSEGSLAAVSSPRILCSINSGNTWNVIYSGNPLLAAVSPENYIYAVFDGSVRVTTNAGFTWTTASTPEFTYSPGMAIDLKGRLYMSFQTGSIYRSEDRANTWEGFGMGIIANRILKLFIDDDGFGYVSTEGEKIYRSTYNFFAPHRIKTIFPPPVGGSLSLNPTLIWNKYKDVNEYNYQVSTNESFEESTIVSEGTIFDTTVIIGPLQSNTHYWWRVRGINSYGAGLWSLHWRFRTAAAISSADDEITKPGFNLQINYPNPFNPSTRIKFSLPSEEYTVLRIYDILGNLITELINEKRSRGIMKQSGTPVLNYQAAFTSAE